MSRIYKVTAKENGQIVRYVRANSLNAAIRARMREIFDASPCTSEEMFQAAKHGKLNVLDAVAPEQTDIDDPKEPTI